MIFEAIRTLREERGLSQAQVAAILGVAQNTYSQYETGKTNGLRLSFSGLRITIRSALIFYWTAPQIPG